MNKNIRNKQIREVLDRDLNINKRLASIPIKNAPKDEEQLMICFLTINRQVVYLRVLFQPPGGFYPVVIAPPNGKLWN